MKNIFLFQIISSKHQAKPKASDGECVCVCVSGFERIVRWGFKH